MKIISVDSFNFNLGNSISNVASVCISSKAGFNGGELIIEVHRNKEVKFYLMKFLRKLDSDVRHTIWQTTHKRVKEITLREVRELRINDLLECYPR
jgi:hypothetical protein